MKIMHKLIKNNNIPCGYYELNGHYIQKYLSYDISFVFYSLKYKEKSQNCTDSHLNVSLLSWGNKAERCESMQF